MSESVVVYRVGGTNYPMKYVHQCLTCRSDHRTFIENLIIMGHPWDGIAAQLPTGAGLTGRNLKDHFENGHMPVPEAQRRALIEQRAAITRQDTETPGIQLVDNWVLAHTLRQRAFELLSLGEIQPDVKDLLASAKLIHEIEDRAAEEKDEMDEQQILRMLKSARSHMDEASWSAFITEEANRFALEKLGNSGIAPSNPADSR